MKMDNEKSTSQELKKWETPVLNSEEFGSTLGGWHTHATEILSGLS